MPMDTAALLAYKVEQMEESLRMAVQTKTGYKTLQYQTRWLDREIRSWVGSVTGYVDRDSFTNFMLSTHFIGCRDVVEALFDKHKLGPEEEEASMNDVGEFSRTIINQSMRDKADTLRRSQGDIY